MPLSNYLSKPSLDMFRQQPSIDNPSLGMYQRQPDILHPTLGMTQEDMARPVVYPSQETQPQQPQATSVPDFVEQNYPRMDLSNDIKKAERDRKRHLLGNVATVFGQGLGSLMGARQFTPIQNNDTYYQQRIDQLRNLQRNYDYNRNAQVFQAKLNDLAAKQKAEADAAAAARKFQQDVALKNMEYGYKQDEKKRDRAYEEEKQKKQNEFQLERDRNNNAARLRQAYVSSSSRKDSTPSYETAYYKDGDNSLRFDLPKGFWNNNYYVTQLYNMLPDHVRAEAEGRWNDRIGLYSGESKKSLSNQQMVNAINANVNEDILEALEQYSAYKNGYSRPKPTANNGSNWRDNPTFGFSPTQQTGKKDIAIISTCTDIFTEKITEERKLSTNI